MNSFSVLIALHLAAVTLTISFFALRYWWRYSNNQLINARWVRVLPHCIDTVLFVSGAGLMWVTGYLPFTDNGTWLTEKLFGVIIYIVLGFTSSLNSPPQEYRYWGKSWSPWPISNLTKCRCAME